MRPRPANRVFSKTHHVCLALENAMLLQLCTAGASCPRRFGGVNPLAHASFEAENKPITSLGSGHSGKEKM
jgi:hypothetical protein